MYFIVVFFEVLVDVAWPDIGTCCAREGDSVELAQH
jgi:hypothetical protein